MTRPDWDTYFLAIAETVAQRADCTRSKVGAVLVNARNEIRGTGYNGSPAGLPGCLTDGACPRGAHRRRTDIESYPYGGQTSTCACGGPWPCEKASEPDSDYSNCIADHAERNALRHSRPEDLKGATLYVTRHPCPGCMTLIEACGIVRVVHPPAIPVDDEWWDRVNEPTRRCLGCGEYEGDQADCLARQEGHGQHVYVYERIGCTHPDNQVTLDKADRIAWICTCGARKEHGGEWSTPEKCTHPWPAQTVTRVEHTNRIQVWCEICGDVTYVEGGR